MLGNIKDALSETANNKVKKNVIYAKNTTDKYGAKHYYSRN